MASLPAELVDAVIDFSQGSKKTLASLALLSKGFRAHAENLLYEEVYVHTIDGTGYEILKAIARSAERAECVRYLSVAFSQVPRAWDEEVKTLVLLALSNAKRLQDLHTQFCRPDLYPFATELSERISKGPFRLKSLFCHDVLDLSVILRHQHSLKVLGVFLWSWRHPITSLVPLLKERPLIACAFECDTYLPVFNWAYFLPEFLPQDDVSNLADILLPIFERINRNASFRLDINLVDSMQFYLTRKADDAALLPFYKSLVQVFPETSAVVIAFQMHGEEIHASMEMERSLTMSFPKLKSVTLQTWH